MIYFGRDASDTVLRYEDEFVEYYAGRGFWHASEIYRRLDAEFDDCGPFHRITAREAKKKMKEKDAHLSYQPVICPCGEFEFREEFQTCPHCGRVYDKAKRVRYIGESYELELLNSKEYEVLSIEKGWYRIIDETGEDYLYPAEWFEAADTLFLQPPL